MHANHPFQIAPVARHLVSRFACTPRCALHVLRCPTHTRLPPLNSLDYGANMIAPRVPQDMIDQMVPDLTLPSSGPADFPLRSRVGIGPLVLFFFIRSGTPG